MSKYCRLYAYSCFLKYFRIQQNTPFRDYKFLKIVWEGDTAGPFPDPSSCGDAPRTPVPWAVSSLSWIRPDLVTVTVTVTHHIRIRLILHDNEIRSMKARLRWGVESRRDIYLLLRRSSKQWTKSYSTTQHSTVITNQERNLYTQ